MSFNREHSLLERLVPLTAALLVAEQPDKILILQAGNSDNHYLTVNTDMTESALSLTFQ